MPSVEPAQLSLDTRDGLTTWSLPGALGSEPRGKGTGLRVELLRFLTVRERVFFLQNWTLPAASQGDSKA